MVNGSARLKTCKSIGGVAVSQAFHMSIPAALCV